MSKTSWKQYRINVPLPVEDRKILTGKDMEDLPVGRRYKWMVVVNATTGVRYQLQFPDGGTIDTPVADWIWRAIDSSAVLTESLYVALQSLGINSGTAYSINTPLETILRDLLSQTRIPIAPTISLNTPTLVEKGSTGTLNLSAIGTLNDATWKIGAGFRYYWKIGAGAWNELGTSAYDYSEISTSIQFKVERDYIGNTVQNYPELSNDLSDGKAISNIVTLPVGLPYFIGIGLFTDAGWDSVDSAFIQNLLNNFHSNKERLIKYIVSAPNIISILYPYWTINNISIPEPKYLWIAIPNSWGKIIESYAANNVDEGIMGSEDTAWTGMEEILLSSPYGTIIWNNEPYKVYYTGYPTNAGYTPTQLFTFTLT